MTRTTSTILLCIVTALVLFLGVFSFIPDFEIGEYQVYHSPLSLMQKSGDFTDQWESTYKLELDEDADFASVKSTLNYRLRKSFGYYGVPIAYDEASGIVTITVPKTSNSSATNAQTVLSEVVANGKIEVLTGTTYSESDVVIGIEHFRRASVRRYVNGNSTWDICEVRLTSEGAEIAKKSLTEGTTYYYAIDGEMESYAVYTNNVLQLYAHDRVEAKVLSGYIKGGILNATLTLDESRELPAGVVGYILAGVFGAIVLASVIFLIVRYGKLGYAAALMQLLAVIIATIFIGLVYVQVFNLFAFIGAILAYAFMTYFTCYTLERIRRRFGESKDFSWMWKKGFSETYKLNLIAHSALLVLGVVLWVIPTIVTAPLGNVLTCGAVLSFVVTFALNRLFAWIVTPLYTETDSSAKGAKK